MSTRTQRIALECTGGYAYDATRRFRLLSVTIEKTDTAVYATATVEDLVGHPDNVVERSHTAHEISATGSADPSGRVVKTTQPVNDRQIRLIATPSGRVRIIAEERTKETWNEIGYTELHFSDSSPLAFSLAGLPEPDN